MSAESPRHVRSAAGAGLGSGGPLTVPSQPPSDRSIIDAVSGFINDVTLSSSSNIDPKDVIQWARFETADINEPQPEGDSDNDISPLLLILGYGSGVQVWLIPPNGEAQEVLSWRQGTVRVLRILPTPQHGDCFASKRPLIALCDSASPGPTFCSLSFISIRGGEQVKSIKFKNPILDVLANKRSVVVSFSERFAVFDAGTLEDRMAVTTCFPCPCPLGGSLPINPLSLGDRWLAYADKKLNQSKRSSGGCEGEGVTSYTATVLHAAKSLSKGLRGLGESVAHSLAGGRSTSQSPSPPNADIQQPGVITILDIEGIEEDDCQDTEEHFDPIVAHFVAHSEAIIALKFDASGMLLVTADRRGHDFHVFRINPHPCGPSLASVHHLYILHRGDTTAKVQDIAISPDSRWTAISTLRGTTHVFAISAYGGACGVRTHTQPRVVNRLSRFHRSAGLPIHAAHAHKRAQASPVGDGLAQGAWFPNPRLPPYPLPTTVSPLAQIRPTANLPTHTITRTSSGRQRLSSVSEDSNSAPLLARARFGSAIGGGRAPAALPALYLVPASGDLLHLLLHPRPLASVPKEKICDDSPIELQVEAIAQWPLQRPPAAADLLAPLPPSNPLLQPLSCRRCADMCMSEEERWLSQVEIVTHAGPHRRLWMGPQFVFKTYNCTGSNSSLSEAETVEVDTSVSRGVARSNPVNMPGVRPVVPVLIDSGSASSLEHSPSDSCRRKSLLAESGRIPSVCDVQLREDLAEAMKEDQGWRERSRERSPRASVAGVSSWTVDPLGTVAQPGPAPPPPPLDPDAYTTSNCDEGTFRPVVRAPAMPYHPYHHMPVRPLPRTTTIPVQTIDPPTRIQVRQQHEHTTDASVSEHERDCVTESLPISNRPPPDIQPAARPRRKKSPTIESDRLSDVSCKDRKSSKIREAVAASLEFKAVDVPAASETEQMRGIEVPKENEKPKVVKTPREIEPPKIVETLKELETPKVVKAPKEIETPKVVKTPKEIETPKVVKSPKEIETPKVVKTPKEIETPKVVKSPKEIETPKVVKSPKEIETPKVVKTPKEIESPKDVKAPKEIEKSKVGKASKEIEPPKDVKAPKEMEQLKVPKAPKEIELLKDVKAPKEIEQSKVAKAPKEIELLKDVKAPKEIEQSKVAKAPKEIELLKDVKAPKEIEQSKVAKAPKEIELLKDVKAPKEIEQSKVAKAPKEIDAPKVVKTSKEMEQSKIVKAPKEIELSKVVKAPKEVELRQYSVAPKVDKGKDIVIQSIKLSEPPQREDFDFEELKEIPVLRDPKYSKAPVVKEPKASKVEKSSKKEPDSKESIVVLEDTLPVAVTLTKSSRKESSSEWKSKDHSEGEINTEEQAWDMLLSEQERPILNVSHQLTIADNGIEESKPKSKKNRKSKKTQEEIQTKADEDSFVEIHAIEDKQQPSSGELVSISMPYEDIEACSYASKIKKARSVKSSTPERKDEFEAKVDIWHRDDFESTSTQWKKSKKIDNILSDVEVLPETIHQTISKEVKRKKVADTLRVECTDYTSSESTSPVIKESPKSKKSKASSPYSERRKSTDKLLETEVKDVYVINTTAEDFPEIQITRGTKSRKKSPQPAERKSQDKEVVTEKPVKSWSSIAASKNVKKVEEKEVERKIETVEKKSDKRDQSRFHDTSSFKEVSLQEKLFELCKRTDIMVAECDAPSELTFIEEHHSVLPDLAPLEPLDFGLDDFNLEVMRDSLLEVNEAKISSPICKINIDDILSSIKETTSKVIESSTFNLIDLERVPPRKERDFSVVETDKITSQDVKLDDDKSEEKEEVMEKSSDDDITSPVVSTDSDKEDKKSAGASNLAMPSSKQSTKSKKSRRKKK